MSSILTDHMEGYKPPRVGCIKCDRSLTLWDQYGKRYEKPGFYAMDGSGPFCMECRRIHNWNWYNPDLSYEQHMREMNRDPSLMLKELRELIKR